MIIHFYLRYHTRYGQTIFVSGNIDALGNDKPAQAIALAYFNNEFWHGTIEVAEDHQEEINYQYILREEGSVDIMDADKNRFVDITTHRAKEIVLIDTWNFEGNIENAFYTKPFQQVFKQRQSKTPKLKVSKNYTHEFKIKAPLLNSHEWVCITGSGKMFKDWDVKNLLPLSPAGNSFNIKINLSKEEFPLRYKYGIYNTKSKTFVFEDAGDRILTGNTNKNQSTVLDDGFINLKRYWKGAGVAIPVFSLRSKNSFGTGEFNDIKLLVDWAKQTGLKLLQFLPVNDTTDTHSAKDSYPYAAISAFALHPYSKKPKNMINAKRIKIIIHLRKTFTPPGIIILLHFFPVVGRKAPVLSLYGKVIRRCSCLFIHIV